MIVRVLVTGHCGYIGSVVASFLQRARFDVVGVDCDWYRDCDFGRVREEVPGFDTDIRDLEFTDLLSFDAVVHLAGVPEDFAGALPSRLTHDINVGATVRLAELCKQAQVGRLLFASSCAVYDCLTSEVIDETHPPSPISDYARSKLQAEQGLLKLADASFSPVILRLATAYGVSPRLRLDTVVNEFVASAVTSGRIDANTAGRAWRPLLHVEDMARAIAALLVADEPAVARQVINVARTAENHRIIDVADTVSQLVTDSTYTMNREIPDRRSYRVSGEKLARLCPNLVWRWTLPDGVRQLRDALTNAGLTPGELRSSRYRRTAYLAGHLRRLRSEPASVSVSLAAQ